MLVGTVCPANDASSPASADVLDGTVAITPKANPANRTTALILAARLYILIFFLCQAHYLAVNLLIYKLIRIYKTYRLVKICKCWQGRSPDDGRRGIPTAPPGTLLEPCGSFLPATSVARGLAVTIPVTASQKWERSQK